MSANPILKNAKRSTSGPQHGLGDWLMQRVTALLMILFTFVVIAQVLLVKGPITYTAWAGIFATPWMKGLTFLTIISMGWHAVVGMRDVFMDYVKPIALRLVLHVGAIVWLGVCAGWALQVLWRL